MSTTRSPVSGSLSSTMAIQPRSSSAALRPQSSHRSINGQKVPLAACRRNPRRGRRRPSCFETAHTDLGEPRFKDLEARERVYLAVLARNKAPPEAASAAAGATSPRAGRAGHLLRVVLVVADALGDESDIASVVGRHDRRLREHGVLDLLPEGRRGRRILHLRAEARLMCASIEGRRNPRSCCFAQVTPARRPRSSEFDR